MKDFYLKNSFKKWLFQVEELSNKTISSYCSYINKVTDILSIEINKEVNIDEVLEMLSNNTIIKEVDKRNGISALKQYKKYLDNGKMNPILHAGILNENNNLVKLHDTICDFECRELVDGLVELNQVQKKERVTALQEKLLKNLQNVMGDEYDWKMEYLVSDTTKDRVDIYGESKKGTSKIIIEIDKHSAEQVAKKSISRLAMFIDSKDLTYISLCYPGNENMSINETKKYFNYINEIFKSLDKKEGINMNYAGFIIEYER